MGGVRTSSSTRALVILSIKHVELNATVRLELIETVHLLRGVCQYSITRMLRRHPDSLQSARVRTLKV